MKKPKHKPRPLTGNHVARELAKLFRSTGIRYLYSNKDIIPLSPGFPPLVFTFSTNSYISVRDKNDTNRNFLLYCPHISTLFIKLIRFRLLSAAALDKLLKSSQ